ncbi:MAG: hypothetical protein MZU84_06315 [Sphingobacterium sp.]|nr:hypothetical protein [Sphingobacterium sp.]
MPAVVEDVIYLGRARRSTGCGRAATGSQVLRQHARFFLDEKPIRWKDDVWICWHARRRLHARAATSEADEKLLAVPPQKVGEDAARRRR